MSNPVIPDPQTLAKETEKERTQVELEAREIDALVKQTSGEVDRLQQRQSEQAQRLHQLDANLESYPREEIKNAYAAAQDAQMRLFMMRSQLEQLQHKRRALQRYRSQLDQLVLVARQLAEAASSVVGSPSQARGVDQQSIIQIVGAQEMERQHLARQMHDGPAQSLTNLILQAEIVERLFDADPRRAREELVNLKMAANSTFQRIRDFIFDLRPMMLDDLGLVPTLKRYAQTFEMKTHLTTELTITGERTLPDYIEIAIFRAIQELLNSVVRHARASRVQVAVDLQKNPVVIAVEDNSEGFDAATGLAAAQQDADADLANLEKRIQMLGGKIQFTGSAGRGTKVRIELSAAV